MLPTGRFRLPRKGPEIPPDRAEASRKAFEDTMHDPAYLAEMKAKRLEVGPIGRRAIVALFKDFYSTPQEVVDETRSIIAGQ